MKIIELDQNSEEWLEYRKGKSGGSAFGKMYKVNGKEDPLEKEMATLQHSCLGNPMDRGAWRAIVHGVAESWTRLSD